MMSAMEAWKETERAMASQDLTVHNLGDDIWEVADQMVAAIAEMETALATEKAYSVGVEMAWQNTEIDSYREWLESANDA